MTAFADLLDLRTAVVEEIGNADLTDVFPRLVKLAEAHLNRVLRLRGQDTTSSLTVTGGSAALPADMAELIGLFTESGKELLALPIPAFEKLYRKEGFYTIKGGLIETLDGEYTLSYFATIPTLSTSLTTSNWLLQKHPSLYLYAVSVEAAKYLRDAESVPALTGLRDQEIREAQAQDASEKYARARVRVVGPTP